MGRARSRFIRSSKKQLIIIFLVPSLLAAGHFMPISTKIHRVCPDDGTYIFRVIGVQLARGNDNPDLRTA
jgi:hypothetical protein